jgi:hypothetical protein
MCLTGVDYFSTLAYQPSIAFLAAGALSPIATLVLVLLTLFGALPMYKRVATMSPHGQGSILILEELFPRWKGKVIVLCLLGFAATDFVITITLSAADASAHLIQNPLTPPWLDHPMIVTLLLLVTLGAIFLRGFREAIVLAVALVCVYLALNVIVVVDGLQEILRHPHFVMEWKASLFAQHGDPMMMGAMAIILFPKLALGLSGFETGVAVMPLVRGDATDTEDNPVGRIRNTKKLLRTAALIMSALLLTSSFVTAVLIPADAFMPGHPADGRALAYLAHERFGSAFGTIFDISTILIFCLLAHRRRRLVESDPHLRVMEWRRARRTVAVLIITGITIAVTIIFKANVDAQGASATGVLGLGRALRSRAITAWRQQHRWAVFIGITVVFAYTTITNVFERPEGIKIASLFIATIVVMSLVSRALRSTELRVHGIMPDELAMSFIEAIQPGADGVRIIANRPGTGDEAEYAAKLKEASQTHHLPEHDPVLFLEVRPGDASNFSEFLKIEGKRVGPYRVLACQSAAVPNAIAALLLYMRDRTGQIPHVYFGWTEGNPITYLLKFLAFGEGDTAPVTREVLRQTEHDPLRRPRVHVG